MAVTYTREMRSKAKLRGVGLGTIGWQDSGGRFHIIQGPVSKRQLTYLKRAMVHFDKLAQEDYQGKGR